MEAEDESTERTDSRGLDPRQCSERRLGRCRDAVISEGNNVEEVNIDSGEDTVFKMGKIGYDLDWGLKT